MIHINALLIFPDKVLDMSERRVKVSPAYTVGMLQNKIRSRWFEDNSVIGPNTALFLFFKDTTNGALTLRPVSMTLYEISQHMGHPAMLEIHVKMENAFG